MMTYIYCGFWFDEYDALLNPSLIEFFYHVIEKYCIYTKSILSIENSVFDNLLFNLLCYNYIIRGQNGQCSADTWFAGLCLAYSAV